jgi:uncharacterized protein YjbI with pentapeptide repeats
MFIFLACFAAANGAMCDTSTEPTVIGPLLGDVVLKPGFDFSGRFFSGTQLVRQDLSGAIFDNADLNGARFIECILEGASFQNSSLTGAAFIDTSLVNADFENATITDCYFGWTLSPSQIKQTRSFREKSLHGVRFTRATLGNITNLQGFDLRNATLVGGGDFRDVAFDGAQITGADFQAKVDFEQLRNTVEVRKGVFPAIYHAKLDCNLSKLDLRGAKLHFPPGIKFDLSDANIDDCVIYLTANEATEAIEATWSYKQGRLRSTVMSGGNLSRINFDNMILDRVSTTQTNFTDASFHNTVIVWSHLGAVEDSLTVRQLRKTYNVDHGLLSEFRFLPDALKAELSVERKQP